MGTGLIGSELLRLINQARHPTASIYVIGLANSRKVVSDSEGIPLDYWKTRLENSNISMDMNRFIYEMAEHKSAYAIFVDCTSSQQIVDQYQNILSNNLSIVTPNKIANTRSWKEYVELRRTAVNHGVKFLYGTNVGAGLPVIQTLRSLVESGDTIVKIEGVFSGTLSYLFNSFTGDRTFSEIVRQARELGYTEPDPRNDLNGLDAARKLLILAREIGLQLELGDIQVESLLSEGSDAMDRVEDFLIHLQKSDRYFESKRSEAEQEEKVLRYIGSLENGQANVRLKAVGKEDPFYSLTGNESICVFTTERYRDNPLIIRGEGAGATVTAAGILADILQVVN